MSPRDLADAFVKHCEEGFQSEHHWLAWRKKHAKEIAALPIPLRNRVEAAHLNATAKEFSR
jgi:hypothetical protein